ncbi:MAG: GNAT family N-acetyltransferase [Acidobacteriaceae bacterium]|nr:GNAT family N-acetyltransferase [Acidobacteriaceae bacterium]
MLSIVTEEREWNGIYAELAHPSVFATYRFVRAGALNEPHGRAELAVWRDGSGLVAHPYIRRAIVGSDGLDDLTCAWEFGGFWIGKDGEAGKDSMLDFGRAFAERCSEERIVSETVRLHPFVPIPNGIGDAYYVQLHSSHVVSFLNRPFEEVWNDYRPSLRNKLRQACSYGLIAAPSRDFDTFVRTYHHNLDRLRASPFYYFPRAFFDAAAPMLELIFIFDRENRLCGTHCYLDDGDVRFAFLCHGVPETLHLRPNDFGYDAAMREAHRLGRRVFHFGGGGDSLTAYKRNFSRRGVPFHIARCVFRPDLYADLCAAKGQSCEPDLTGNTRFPAYRF